LINRRLTNFELQNSEVKLGQKRWG